MSKKIKLSRAYEGFQLTDLLSEAREINPKGNDLEALDSLISHCYEKLWLEKNNVLLERKIMRATELRAVLFQKEVEQMAKAFKSPVSLFNSFSLFGIGRN
ncbi:MAG: hypothetical protein HF314_12150 [Ignavibacteria bacterium]|jgi:hypothetical protein|nr:hypothetical protein [Ignavibacteria bacterium]MCU7503823.1 hypothetical protein [Ignavibacteria bacterium]MCU7517163.1 hypothetical protein [Ignavibacteria bacterium]